MTTKTCPICKEALSTELFSKRSDSKDGLQGKCKPCSKIEIAKYRKDNKAKIAAQTAKYYQDNKVELNANKAEYRKDNKVEIAVQQAEYYQDNKAEIIAYNKEYHQANKAERNTKSKDYKKANPHLTNVYEAKRRALKLQQTPAWYASEHEAIQELYKKAQELGMHVDHIIPLNNELVSGLHTSANLQLLTPEENLSKSNKFAC